MTLHLSSQLYYSVSKDVSSLNEQKTFSFFLQWGNIEQIRQTKGAIFPVLARQTYQRFSRMQ